MKKKIFAITVSVLTFLSSLGWASELEKDELNEVVAFAKTLGAYDCYDFEDAYRHTRMNQVHTVGEHSIYRIGCRLHAYNLAEIWFQRSDQGSLKPIYFAKPILSSSRVVSLETVNELMNAAFDPETDEISTHEKWVGHGDQSEGGTWKFEHGRFVLKEYHVDAVADQKVDPITVFEGD